MSGVIDLDDYRPHVAVMGADGGVYVYPSALIKDVIFGRKPTEVINESVLRKIVSEWYYNSLTGDIG